MKRIRLLSLMVIIVSIIYLSGCKRNQQIPAIELSFCDFVLGGNFDDCFHKASMSDQYEDLSKSKDGLIEHASFFSIHLPNFESPEFNISAINGKVDSYQGIIYEIRYDSYNVETIVKMYQAKYGIIKPKRIEYEESNRFGAKENRVILAYFWSFENADLRVSETYRDEYGSKKDDIVSVTYTDRTVNKAAQPDIEKKHRQIDSIMRNDLEMERIKREKEELIKKKQQKEILESLRF